MVAGLMACKKASGTLNELETENPFDNPAAASASKTSNTQNTKPGLRADAAITLGYIVGCPEWMVRIPDSLGDFCIDRFEAHLVELKAGSEVVHPTSSHPRKKGLVAKSAPGILPQSSVNRFDAEEACRNAGKRLCMMREWKMACVGRQGFVFPYGDTEAPDICNTNKEHLVTKFFGADNRKWRRQDMNDPLLNKLGLLARPGTYPGCLSSFGVYDMVGNLHEWVSDLVDERMLTGMPRAAKKDPKFLDKTRAGNGIFMGGFFSSGNQNGKGCSYTTTAHHPMHYDYSTGFRCCKEPEG
jgi:formylglycine-generating enzyme required for sulfatase activity